MFSNKNFVFLTLVIGLALTGCGRNYSGVYQGQEQVNDPYSAGTIGTGTSAATAGQPTMKPYNVTLTLDQQGDQVRGQYTSSSGITGTFSGTVSGQGITNATMTTTATTSGYNGVGSYPYYGVGTGCSMTYQAPIISFNNNHLTGTFSVQGGLMNNYSCGPGTGTIRQFDVGK